MLLRVTRAWQLHRSGRFRRATSRFRVLPSFLIIGTQPAGTVSLFGALRRHPEIHGPNAWEGPFRRSKELHFFDRKFARGVDWYRSCFPLSTGRLPRRLRGAGVVAGEATSTYLTHPDVPARVATILPDVSLIALLRNPVERAYWHYESMRRNGLEPRSFEEALEAEQEHAANEEHSEDESGPRAARAYVGRGLYADHLERWLRYFPRERLLVLRAEDYAARPREIYDEVVSFLGVEGCPPRRFRRPNWTEAPIDRALRARLNERFAESNARLAPLLGQDIGWD